MINRFALLVGGLAVLSVACARFRAPPRELTGSPTPVGPRAATLSPTPARSGLAPPAPSVPAGFAQLFPLDISFVDSSHGWFLGYSPDNPARGKNKLELRVTNDGGSSWSVLPAPAISPGFNPPPCESGEVSRIYFATVLDGWLYGGGLYVTHDGGYTWNDEQPNGDVLQLATADGTVWALEHRCTATTPYPLQLLSTAYSGQTWQPLATQPPAESTAGPLLRMGRGEAWLFGHVAAVHTRDAGASWQTVALPQPACGTADHNQGPVLAASAGGRLWLLCLEQPSAGNQMRHLFTSDDDGRHWTEIPNQPRIGYASVLVALTPERAFIGLMRGNLTYTVDGGITWRPATPRSEAFYKTIDFVDSTHGWALTSDDSGPCCGYEASIWRTRDAGATWERIVVH